MSRMGMVATFVAAVLFVLLSQGTSDAGQDKADRAFVNGRVMLFPDVENKPMSSAIDFAEAVTVTDGKISYVGTTSGAQDFIDGDTVVTDLGGRMLMPGLGDGHTHAESPLDCEMGYEGGTVEHILGVLKQCLLRADQVGELNTNKILHAEHLMGDGVLPNGTVVTRHDLDRLSEDPGDDEFGTGTTRPIVIDNMDHHKFYINTAALDYAIANSGFDPNAPTPPGSYIGRDDDGYPNGVFSDFRRGPNYWGIPMPVDEIAGLATNIREMNTKGITNIFRPMGDPADAGQLADQGELTVRFNQGMTAFSVRGATDTQIDGMINGPWPTDLPTPPGPPRPAPYPDGFNAERTEWDGYTSPNSPGVVTVNTAKVGCDGVAETPGQTAAMLDPYRENIGTEENPHWVPTTWRGPEPACENGLAGWKALDAAGWSVHVHAIGDRAVRTALDNFERIQATNPEWDRRDTITHLQFVDPNDRARFGELGVTASMSLQWNQRDAWSVDGVEGYIAPNRTDRMYPTKSVVDGGGLVAQGSDWTVTELLPWTSIEQAVTREGDANPARAIYPGPLSPEEGISLVQAIKASTWAVAYQLRNEDITGSIEVGKAADMIIVDQDLIRIPGSAQADFDRAQDDLATAEVNVSNASAAVTDAEKARDRAEVNARKAANRAKRAKAKQANAKRRLKRARGARAVRNARKALKRARRAARRERKDANNARAFHSRARAEADMAAAAAQSAIAARDAASDILDQARAALAAARDAHIRNISETEVLMTMLNGQVVYAQPGNPLGVTED